jgi:hypothetical protein
MPYCQSSVDSPGLPFRSWSVTLLRRRHVLVLAFTAVTTVGLWFTPRAHVAAQSLPSRLGDKDFWALIVDFSEPGGFFRSDNLISNESTFQHVIPELQTTTHAGAYVGVGPDQNFTYIAALKPKMAFIVDIRRQNMLLHLMYKALIELSTDRADFLSRLFARPRPEGLGPEATAQSLFDAFNGISGTEELVQINLKAILNRLEQDHGFPLSVEDENSIKYVYTSFYIGGPEIRYSFPRGDFGGARWFPSYADLMVETDLGGKNHSYIASEDYFRTLQEYEKANLIVPLVGDFAGDRALRSVGRYLRDHDATVTTFYTSNVEQYLFQGDGWKRFFDNVATLPVDEHSTLVRAYFNNMGFRYQPPGALPGARSSTLLDPIPGLLKAFANGQIQTYYDVVSRSK